MKNLLITLTIGVLLLTGATCIMLLSNYTPQSKATDSASTEQPTSEEAAVDRNGNRLIQDNEIWYTSYDGKKIEFGNYNGDNKIISNIYENGIGILTFEESVVNVYRYMFSDCTKLETIVLPKSVTNIENYAFIGCTYLNDIDMPISVNKIGKGAFENCRSLTSITIPNGVSKIVSETFNGCISLQTFHGKYASNDGRYLIIGEELVAFALAGLTEYVIPDGATKIGEYAFSGCDSLQASRLQMVKLRLVNMHLQSVPS